jgi:hypothetical protein
LYLCVTGQSWCCHKQAMWEAGRRQRGNRHQ